MIPAALRFLPRVFFPGRFPLHLTFFVTARCNSACRYCFYPRSAADPSGEMSAAEFERAARSLRTRLLWLLISGGEPFLHPELAEICAAFYRHNRPAYTVLPTNCLLPARIEAATSEVCRSSPDSAVVLKASLDGWGKDHDDLRGVPGNFERFRETVERIGKLKRSPPNLSLGVNTVVLPQNIDRVLEVRQKALALPGVDYHNISLVRTAGIPSEFGAVDPEKYLALSRALREEARKEMSRRGYFPGALIKNAQDLRQREIVYRVLTTGRRQLECFAGRLNLVLTETGDVYPCEPLPVKLGNLRESGYDLRRILSGDRTRECLARIHRGDPVCDGCTNECYLITDILFSPRELVRAASAVFRGLN